MQVQERPASLEHAVANVDDAAAAIFESDPTIRSVGVYKDGDSVVYRAVRNSAIITPQFLLPRRRPERIQGVPVLVTETPGEIESLLKVPHSGPASPAAASVVPEVRRHRPLCCGLQIQNFDDDQRQGVIAQGFIIIGTLGCFIQLSNGRLGILSNNHVIAGENRGQRGADRICQAGANTFVSSDHICTLAEFEQLKPSPPNARPALGNVDFNEIDAATAELLPDIHFDQAYLPSRGQSPPSGIAVARNEDRVFKVGRTTGLTRGIITDIATTVGPVGYSPGLCWFRRSLTIEGIDGTQFSDKGDSGSAIVLEATNQVVGLLYAGNGKQTYACPIQSVLTGFNCMIA
jgi:hypothetical protein